MPLWHFLYRCPDCGADPTEGEGDRIVCPDCGLRCERVRGGVLHLARPGEAPSPVSAEELASRIEAFGGAETRAVTEGGCLLYRARAQLRRLREEETLRWGGRLGYREVLDEGEDGTLELSDDHLAFASEEAGTTLRWALLDVGSLQASSSSVHVRVPGLELAVFAFPEDSPRRWEELLARALSRAWEQAGRGRIVEFQPKITVER